MKNITSLFIAILGLNSGVRAAETQTTLVYEPSSLNTGIDIRYVPVLYKNYRFTDGDTLANKYGFGISFAGEWIAIDSFGKIGLGLGSGFFAIHDFQLAKEKFVSLYTVPVEVFLSYRLDYVKDQILVPFGRVGPTAIFLRESSRSGAMFNDGTRVYSGWDAAVGLEICLNQLDRNGSRALENNFGINNSYLVAEYLRSQNRRLDGPDLSREEVRFGLRFEL